MSADVAQAAGELRVRRPHGCHLVAESQLSALIKEISERQIGRDQMVTAAHIAVFFAIYLKIVVHIFIS